MMAFCKNVRPSANLAMGFVASTNVQQIGASNTNTTTAANLKQQNDVNLLHYIQRET